MVGMYKKLWTGVLVLPFFVKKYIFWFIINVLETLTMA